MDETAQPHTPHTKVEFFASFVQGTEKRWYDAEVDSRSSVNPRFSGKSSLNAVISVFTCLL
jgi:hypothetical protein